MYRCLPHADTMVCHRQDRYPGDALCVRRRRTGGPVCEHGGVPAARRSAEVGTACGGDVRLPARCGGPARIVVRRVTGTPDQRMRRMAARLIAEEREVAPSFM